MGLLNIKAPAGVNTSSVASKVQNSKKKVTTRRLSGNTILDRINLIRTKVEMELGHLAEKYICIRTEEELKDYVDKCIAFGECSFDTETTGLNTIDDELVGFSLYVPGEKACYIPVNHRSYVDNLVTQNQVSMEAVTRQLSRLVNTKLIMQNGKFDINVMYWQNGIKFFDNLGWDTMVCTAIIDEREPRGLKYQYAKKVQKSDKINDYSELFDGVNFAYVPIKVAYLYGAKDAEITYELYQYQKEILEKPENSKLKELYMTIELPLVPVIAEMQREGVSFDMEKAKELSDKYNKQLDKCMEELDEVCNMYGKEIAEWNRRHPKEYFTLPLNPNSSKQVAQFLYDILGVESVDKHKERGTGEEILEQIDEPVVKCILKYREIKKLLSTYIDKMPKVVNAKTGRIHASFNQMVRIQVVFQVVTLIYKTYHHITMKLEQCLQQIKDVFSLELTIRNKNRKQQLG